MSTDIIESRVAELNSLCEHYVSVLAKKREEVDKISQELFSARHKSVNDELGQAELDNAQAKLYALQSSFSRLQPALEKLIRTASQTVEHSVKDDIEGLKLEILLADLEANLQQTSDLIARSLLISREFPR